MTKPRYPAHVVRLLNRYPAKWCEECGQPILPRLEQPNSRYPRTHLEQLTKFKKKRWCSRGCARRARARKERAAKSTKADPQPEPAATPKAATITTPRFPAPDGLHASQLTIGHAYAQPQANGNGHGTPPRRHKRRRFDKRPISIQVTDLITRTKGRPFTPSEIAKAFDLTEPEADTLLGELADNHQVRKRIDPLGRPQYESIRP